MIKMIMITMKMIKKFLSRKKLKLFKSNRPQRIKTKMTMMMIKIAMMTNPHQEFEEKMKTQIANRGMN